MVQDPSWKILFQALWLYLQWAQKSYRWLYHQHTIKEEYSLYHTKVWTMRNLSNHALVACFRPYNSFLSRQSCFKDIVYQQIREVGSWILSWRCSCKKAFLTTDCLRGHYILTTTDNTTLIVVTLTIVQNVSSKLMPSICEYPFATRLALYLSVVPSYFNFVLNTISEKTTFIPSYLGINFQFLFFFKSVIFFLHRFILAWTW